MHVQHSVHINRPIEESSSALAEAAPAWFPRLNARSRASVGVKVAGIPVRKRVTVTLGEPARAGDWTNVSVTWKATGPEMFFPFASNFPPWHGQ